MLHEDPIDVYRIAEHAKRQVSLHANRILLTASSCLPMLRDHPKRDELLDVLIDAGESAWARGAHEVGCLVHGITLELNDSITVGIEVV